MKTLLKTVALCITLLGATALGTIPVQAYMGDEGAPPSGRHFKQMAKELQLTQQQQRQIRDIFARSRPTAEPYFKQLMVERHALRSLVQADTIDEAAIRAESAKMAAVLADLAVHRAQVSHEIRSVLTPEQITRGKELQDQRDKKMESRKNRPGKRAGQES